MQRVILLLKIMLTWWGGTTIGTYWFTKRYGVRVGTDSQGNVYYRDARDRRRWVIYNGLTEASRVPALWDAWLHYTLAHAPQSGTDGKAAFKPHAPNLTGTPYAYMPDGAPEKGGQRTATHADYHAWTPDEGRNVS